MSSISSSDRSNSDEKLRQSRELYKEREEELVKKHRRELKRINQAHADSLEKMRQSTDDRLAQLREKSQKALSRQDMEYQKDINELKSFYETRLRKSNSESFDRERNLIMQGRQQKQALEQKHEYRIDKLREDHAKTMDNKDRQLADLSVRNKNEHQKGFKELRQKLSEAHNEELSIVQSDKRAKVNSLRKDYDRLRTEKDRNIERLEEKYAQDTGDLRKSQFEMLREKDENYQNLLEYQRKEFQKSLSDNRKEYAELQEEQSQKNKDAQMGLAKDVSDRTNGRISSLERSLRDSEREKVQQRINMNRAKASEVNNLKSAMKANIDALQEEKTQIVAANTKDNAKKFQEIREEGQQHINETNRFYLNKVADMEARQRVKDIKSDLKYDTDMNKLRSEEKSRKEVLRQAHLTEQERLKDNYDRSKEVLKQNHAQALDEIQRSNQMEKEELISSLQKRVSEISQKQNEQMTKLHQRYQEQIVKIQDDHKKEIRQLEDYHKRTAATRTRQTEQQKEARELKFKAQADDMKMAHKEQIDRIQARHREELESLINRRRS